MKNGGLNLEILEMINKLISGKFFFAILLLLALPLFIIILESFDPGGNTKIGLSGYYELLKYVRLSELLNIASRSLTICLVSTIIGYLISYALVVSTTSKFQAFFLILITLPFLANEAVRVFSWQNILAENGVFNKFLLILGDRKAIFSSANGANIYATMVAACIPFAIFICTATLKVIPEIYWKVCNDLKLTQFSKFIKVALPISKFSILGSLVVTYFIAFSLSSEVSFLGGATKISARGFVLSLMSANKFESIFALGTLMTMFLLIICITAIFTHKYKSAKV